MVMSTVAAEEQEDKSDGGISGDCPDGSGGSGRSGDDLNQESVPYGDLEQAHALALSMQTLAPPRALQAGLPRPTAGSVRVAADAAINAANMQLAADQDALEARLKVKFPNATETAAGSYAYQVAFDEGMREPTKRNAAAMAAADHAYRVAMSALPAAGGSGSASPPHGHSHRGGKWRGRGGW